MRGEKLEQCRQLCELAAIEQDPEKLLAWVKEINRLLDEKEPPEREIRGIQAIRQLAFLTRSFLASLGLILERKRYALLTCSDTFAGLRLLSCLQQPLQ